MAFVKGYLGGQCAEHGHCFLLVQDLDKPGGIHAPGSRLRNGRINGNFLEFSGPNDKTIERGSSVAWQVRISMAEDDTVVTGVFAWCALEGEKIHPEAVTS